MLSHDIHIFFSGTDLEESGAVAFGDPLDSLEDFLFGLLVDEDAVAVAGVVQQGHLGPWIDNVVFKF
jgi:hypothetical protein